jgi:hypothetical protein
MLPQAQYSGVAPPQAVPPVRSPSSTVARWGIVIVVVLLTPSTVLMFVPGPVEILSLEFVAFFWGFAGIGYVVGIWMARDAQRRGMNGVHWGLICAVPGLWPLIFWAYSFASYQRPYGTPPS